MHEATSARRRPSRVAYRRRRLAAALAALAVGGAIAAAIVSGGPDGAGNSGGATVTPAATSMRLAVSRARPLAAPVSGETAVTMRGKVLLIGGLGAGGSSASGVYSYDPKDGSLSSAGSLVGPLHDAAGAVVGGRALVLGGGSGTSSDVVQAISPGGGATVVGHLPAPRSDLAAASLGGRAYVIGGYDGKVLQADVLATRDGRRFRAVARLPVPVRYPAVAAVGAVVYAFGGETASGAPTGAIQAVDTRSGGAQVIGRLPYPLDHAAALALGDTIYVLGGMEGERPTDRIVGFDPGSDTTRVAGHLPEPVASAAAAKIGDTGYLFGGVGRGGASLASVTSLRLVRSTLVPAASSTSSTTVATAASAPFSGELMIADRGNNRIIVVNAQKQVLWRYPGPGRPPPPGGFYFPDDAFFVHGGAGIITNQEQNETIVELSYPGGKVLWTYGHPGVTGSSPGYLHEPDDAYLLRNGKVIVADAQNCRILTIDVRTRRTSQLGTSGDCAHDPPRAFAYPNGDTPLPNGHILVSEVNGSYVDEVTPSGRLVWSTHLPIAYPSDPQRVGQDRYLVADYARPGGVYEFNRRGKVLWSYRPTHGSAMLDHPSLAEQLPSGDIIVNDDYRHRVVIIDPKSERIVWQYGHTDHPGRGPGQLNIPDGLDLLDPATGQAPTHPYTG